MMSWQLLGAGRASRAGVGQSRAGVGQRVHGGHGVLVHYRTAAAPDGFRREKISLQQLNRRLTWYLQQVECLETANQRLEHHIQEELDRKCPRELRQLDGHLRTASLLRDQISECLSDQTLLKLQLLRAELSVYDLTVRCEKERERRGCVEAELSDLRLLEEVLKVHILPELRTLLNDQTQQLMELQIQHRQDTQGLLAQVSGGVAVEMQSAGSLDLVQQLDDLRQMSVTLFNKNQNQDWFSAQVSMLSSSKVTFGPSAGSEVVQAELEELRRTGATLEEELNHLQDLNMVLDASGLEQTESFIQQLVVLRQRADCLCRDLDSVLQAAAQQAADHQVLLDAKSRLETEILDYRRLLDGLSPQGVSSLQPAANVTSFCETTSPSAIRRNITANNTTRIQGGNLRMMGISRGSQTPVIAPLSETVTTIQSIRVHSKHSKNSPVRSINTSNLTGSFHKAENQRTGAVSKSAVRESKTVDPSKETAAEVKKETENQVDFTEGSIQATNQDPAQVVPLSLETPTEAVLDAGKGTVTASTVSRSDILRSCEAQGKLSGEGAVVNTSKPEINSAQGITSLVPDTQSARSAAAQAKPESLMYKQTTTYAGFQTTKTRTKVQTEITKNSLCAEHGLHFVTQATGTDPSKETAAEVKKETETQVDFTEGSIQTTNQDPAQVVSLSLGTPAEAVLDAGEGALTASIVSGSLLKFEEAQHKVSGELTLIDDKDIEREGKKGEEVEGPLSNEYNSEPNKVMEDADMKSSIATASSSNPDSKDNLEIKTASTEILNKVELVMNKGKVIDGFHDTNKVKMDPTESDNEIVNLAGQEGLFSSTKSKKSVNLTDSSVALSSSDHEDILSPSEAHVFVSPTKPSKCLSPETFLSPVETEMLMSMTNQVFCPVDPEQHVQSPDSLLSPNDPEMFLSPNDSDTRLNPVEAKGCLSPNGEEEDEEVCLNLTEANAHVRPVEKYILSTKEDGRTLLLSRDQALLEEDRKRKVNISKRDGDRLCFGSFGGNKRSRGTLNGTKINSRSTNQGSSSLGGSEFGGLGIIAKKEEQLGFGGLYRKSVRGVRSSRDSERVSVKSASFGSVPANGGTTFSGVASNSGGSGMACVLATSFGGMVADSSGAVGGNTEADSTAEVQGRFKRGSGDWMVYGGSLGHTSKTIPSTGGEESPSGAALPATSRPETGRFSSRGGAEWMVYGGSLGRKSSLTGMGSEESLSVIMPPATSPTDTRRYGSRGSEERMVYSGSLKRSDSLPITESRERQSMTMHLPKSPPEKGRFGSRGSGEWRVYGGNTGRMSSVGGSDSLPNADSEESLSVAIQLATSPPGTLRARRFGSADGGEWRVYGRSAGRLGSASNADRANYGQVISPPSSYTSSGPRLRSASSGGRLSSGSVVRRSSSVGSGGRLSSSGSSSKISSSSRSSSSGRLARTGSGESKPGYSSASGRRSTVGSAGRPGGGGTTSSQRAPSPGGRISVGSGGWLSSSTAGRGGAKLGTAGSSDRISSSSGSGRTNSTGGRVISSSDRPIRSTGSGAGSNKERISVCKMAALSISAAGRERSQDRQRQQQQQQQAAASSPLVQRWLTTGVGVTSTEPDGLGDILPL